MRKKKLERRIVFTERENLYTTPARLVPTTWMMPAAAVDAFVDASVSHARGSWGIRGQRSRLAFAESVQRTRVCGGETRCG
jgi:hypothetical protein